MTSSRGPMFASRPVKHRSCELEMGEAGLWTEGVVAVVQMVGNVGVWWPRVVVKKTEPKNTNIFFR